MALGYVPRERGDGMMRMTKVEAQALAAFISRIRPDWQQPGIIAALEKASPLGSAAAVAAALCKLAENHDLRTPALLADTGPHWSGTTVASRTPPVMCPDHPSERAGACLATGSCSREVVTDPARAAELANAARAAIPHRTPTHTHPQPAATDLRAVRERIDQTNAKEA